MKLVIDSFTTIHAYYLICQQIILCKQFIIFADKEERQKKNTKEQHLAHGPPFKISSLGFESPKGYWWC